MSSADDSRVDPADLLPQGAAVGSMKRTLLAGAGWMTALQLASKVVEIGFTAVLARLLVPADFGVIAGAMIFIQLASMLVEIGIGATLVQLPGLTGRDVRAASTLVFLNACGYFLLAQILAPFAGSLIGIDAVTPVIRVLAFIFLLQAIGIVPENLLVRRLEVNRAMVAGLGARVLGTGCIGVPLAFLGWGYWALVVATLAESLIKALWVFAIIRPSMRPLLTRPLAKRLLSKGSGFSAAKLLNFVALRAPNAIVGRTMDAAALGLYSRAYNLMSVPADLYGRIAERLIFPAMAQVQEDTPRLRRAYLRGVELTAVLGMPLSALLALLAPDIIALVLGSKWTAVITPFAVLSIATYFRLGAKISGSLQRAKGAVRAMVVNQIVYALMVVGGCLLSYPYGITAVAWSVSIGVVIFYCVISGNACRLIGVGPWAFAAAHRHGLLMGIVTTVVAATAVIPLRQLNAPAFVVLAGAGAMVGLFGMLMVFRRPPWLLGAATTELAGDVARAARRRFARGRAASGIET